MYRESFDFPVLEEKQCVVWDGVPVVIVKTQLHLSNWGHLVLEACFEGIRKFPTDIPLHPIDKLPPILAIYNGERIFFHLNDFIPLSFSFFFSPFEGYKLTATVTPIIPSPKEAQNFQWEALIPYAAFGCANGAAQCYHSGKLPLTNDTITFVSGDRNWTLRSLVQEEGYLTLYEHFSIPTTLINFSKNGMVLSTHADGISLEEFQAKCEELCAVMEFAFGTPLVPYTYSKRFTDGSRYPCNTINIKQYPQGKWGALRSENCGTRIPRFIKDAYLEYFKNEKWWNITRHWYVHMLCTHEVDAGNFYASLLFDRIFDYVSKQDSRHEEWLKAHSNLTDKKKGKKATYIGKLMYLSETFTEDFNCARFKECRNALVHEGEPDTDFPNNVNNHRETINFITKIVLNLLGYRGEFQRRTPITHT